MQDEIIIEYEGEVTMYFLRDSDRIQGVLVTNSQTWHYTTVHNSYITPWYHLKHLFSWWSSVKATNLARALRISTFENVACFKRLLYRKQFP